MTDHKINRTITFDKLHYHLACDPYYGVTEFVENSKANKSRETAQEGWEDDHEEVDAVIHPKGESEGTAAVLKQIQHKYQDWETFQHFEYRFNGLPCKNDTQRLLILLWCGLMGLNARREDKPLGWQWEDFLKHWKGGFEFELDDIRSFLRDHRWPLPSELFPREVDNTTNQLHWTDEESELAFQRVIQQLPLLKAELEELSGAQPETYREQKEKKREIARIRNEIASIEDHYCISGTGEAATPVSNRRLKGLQDELRLQREANDLAETWKTQGRKEIYKTSIAFELHNRPAWRHLKPTTIERLLRVKW